MNWMPLQSGVGIELEGETLRAVLAKRNWKRLRYSDRLEIANYRELGPVRCGELFREFLRKNGQKSPWTAVALPRSSVLLRYLQFPLAAEKSLSGAIQYQVDSLHPFEEGSVYWSYAALKSGSASANDAGKGVKIDSNASRIEVIVAIAEMKAINELADWFRSAGIGISQFTVSTASLLALARLAPTVRALGKAAPFLLLHSQGRRTEIAGVAPNLAFVSKELDWSAGIHDEQEAARFAAALGREISLLRAELRLRPDDRVPLILSADATAAGGLLTDNTLAVDAIALQREFAPLEAAVAAGLQKADSVAFAAACAAADSAQPYNLNLLPEERRTYESSAPYIPAYGLAAMIAILGIAMAVRGTVQDWQYNKYLAEQIQTLQPQISEVEHIQNRNKKTFGRIGQLAAIRKQTGLPLAAMNELTALIPDDAWVQQLIYDGQTISIQGNAKSASQIIPALANSVHFENPQLLSAISKGTDGKEAFRIGFRLKATQ